MKINVNNVVLSKCFDTLLSARLVHSSRYFNNGDVTFVSFCRFYIYLFSVWEETHLALIHGLVT